MTADVKSIGVVLHLSVYSYCCLLFFVSQLLDRQLLSGNDVPENFFCKCYPSFLPGMFDEKLEPVDEIEKLPRESWSHFYRFIIV